jgi:hypothetical protein
MRDVGAAHAVNTARTLRHGIEPLQITLAGFRTPFTDALRDFINRGIQFHFDAFNKLNQTCNVPQFGAKTQFCSATAFAKSNKTTGNIAFSW